MTARVTVSDEVLTEILNYLAQRPWREVQHLIEGIRLSAEAVQAEAEESKEETTIGNPPEMVADFPPAFHDS